VTRLGGGLKGPDVVGDRVQVDLDPTQHGSIVKRP
jgi:hypothetical protein